MPDQRNSAPSLGVCYYPEHWDEGRWPADLQRMRSLGIRYVRVAEFAWSRFEPEPERFDFSWLERFLDLAHQEGLAVVAGTPTACPPKWLIDSMPDMIALDEDGLPLGFGSRRHYCFSHEGYRLKCRQIVTRMAEAVGAHPAVYAWQIDNEFGCHDTALSYSPTARTRFRQWLRQRYRNIAALNHAWGNVFWSMEYRDFDEIELPNRTPAEPNPAHRLDFRRFSSDMIRQFQQVQLEVLRHLSPGRPITHNFMGGFTDFDHFEVARDLDFASWDVYPLGFLASVPFFPESDRKHFLRSGDPDYGALHHDLYRACGRGRWWIMEQQPGPVNWAPYNPAPLPGMVRLWTLEAFAHGAEVVSYFRWRQAPFAQEQYHAGLHLPDGQPDAACAEIAQLTKELSVFDGETPERGDVALLFDYEADWTIAIQPQTVEFTYLAEVVRFYRALRRRGLNVDIVPQGGDLTGYPLIVVPPLPIVRPEFVEAVRRSTGLVLFGPRLGSKTAHFSIPPNLPPGPVQEFLPLRVVRVDALPRFAPQAVHWNGERYEAEIWVEQVTGDLQPLARLEDGRGVLFRHGRFLYLAALPDARWLGDLVKMVATEQQLPLMDLPEGVRTRRFGALRFFFNYNPHPVKLAPFEGLEFLTGGTDLPAAGVLIGRRKGR
ncbi:MAG: beta-galactosidase [Verrucomicrobia bacterium]|nr:beta-galactosidase [Verrucomicrobiota bacterium]